MGNLGTCRIAEVVLFLTFKRSNSRIADRKRILSWNSHSRSFILQSIGRQGVADRYIILPYLWSFRRHSHLNAPDHMNHIATWTLYFQKLESLAYTFVIDGMGLASFKFLQWVPKDASFLQQSAFWPFKVIRGHPRSMILVPIESTYATSY